MVEMKDIAAAAVLAIPRRFPGACPRTSPDTRRFKRPTKATLGLGKRPKSP